MTRETPLGAVVKGGLAGLAGTAAITIGMQQGPKVLQWLGQAPRPSTDHEDDPKLKLARKISEGVLETPLDERTGRVAAQAIHWTYGAAWGALFGVVESSVPLPAFAHGALLGGAVGLAASTVVPAARLSPPPAKQPRAMVAMMTLLHFLYGYVTVLTFMVLARKE